MMRARLVLVLMVLSTLTSGCGAGEGATSARPANADIPAPTPTVTTPAAAQPVVAVPTTGTTTSNQAESEVVRDCVEGQYGEDEGGHVSVGGVGGDTHGAIGTFGVYDQQNEDRRAVYEYADEGSAATALPGFVYQYSDNPPIQSAGQFGRYIIDGDGVDLDDDDIVDAIVGCLR